MISHTQAHEVHGISRELGITRVHARIYSPQSNRTAWSFVNTCTRDDVSQMDRSTAAVVMAQMTNVFTHFSEVYPYSALKQKLPRMYGRELVRQAQENDANSYLSCVIT